MLEIPDTGIRIEIQSAYDLLTIRSKPELKVAETVDAEWHGPGFESAFVYVYLSQPKTGYEWLPSVDREWNPSVHLDIDLRCQRLLRYIQKLSYWEVAAWTLAALPFVEADPKEIDRNLRAAVRRYNDERGF